MYFAFEISIIIIDEKSNNIQYSIVKLSINFKIKIQMISILILIRFLEAIRENVVMRDAKDFRYVVDKFS